jgi:hypothetical protein
MCLHPHTRTVFRHERRICYPLLQSGITAGSREEERAHIRGSSVALTCCKTSSIFDRSQESLNFAPRSCSRKGVIEADISRTVQRNPLLFTAFRGNVPCITRRPLRRRGLHIGAEHRSMARRVEEKLGHCFHISAANGSSLSSARASRQVGLTDVYPECIRSQACTQNEIFISASFVPSLFGWTP